MKKKKLMIYGIIGVISIIAIALLFNYFTSPKIQSSDNSSDIKYYIRSGQPCQLSSQCESGSCIRKDSEFIVGKKTEMAWSDAKVECGKKTEGYGLLTFKQDQWICLFTNNICA